MLFLRRGNDIKYNMCIVSLPTNPRSTYISCTNVLADEENKPQIFLGFIPHKKEENCEQKSRKKYNSVN